MTRHLVVVGLLSTLVLAAPVWSQEASDTGDGEAQNAEEEALVFFGETVEVIRMDQEL